MAVKTRLQGFDDILKFFDKQPENCKRIIEKSMKAGAKAGAKSLRKAMPSRWKKLPKSKTGIDARDEIWARFGMYNNRVTQGHQPKAYQEPAPDGKKKTGITDWFKWYWQEYGTLARRDPSHKFTKPVRARVVRRNNVGQPARLTYERAIEPAQRQFKEAFEKAFQKNAEELYKK